MVSYIKSTANFLLSISSGALSICPHCPDGKSQLNHFSHKTTSLRQIMKNIFQAVPPGLYCTMEDKISRQQKFSEVNFTNVSRHDEMSVTLDFKYHLLIISFSLYENTRTMSKESKQKNLNIRHFIKIVNFYEMDKECSNICY